MNKQTRNKAYPQEFREQVVKLAQAGGQTVSEIAREFEISTDSVRRWLKQAERDAGCRQDGLSTPERKELAQLRRDIRRLPSRRAQANRALSREIAQIHEQSRGTYGARRVQAQLRVDGSGGSSTPKSPTGCGWRTSRMCRQRKGLCTWPRCWTCSAARSWAGPWARARRPRWCCISLCFDKILQIIPMQGRGILWINSLLQERVTVASLTETYGSTGPLPGPNSLLQ